MCLKSFPEPYTLDPKAPDTDGAEPVGACGSDSLLAHRPSLPALLEQLSFPDYEGIFSRWRNGIVSFAEVQRQYGSEVLEMLETVETHTAVSALENGEVAAEEGVERHGEYLLHTRVRTFFEPAERQVDMNPTLEALNSKPRNP